MIYPHHHLLHVGIRSPRTSLALRALPRISIVARHGRVQDRTAEKLNCVGLPVAAESRQGK